MIVHRDNTLTYWSVTEQVRRKHVRTVSDADLATLPERTRKRAKVALKHWCHRCGEPATTTRISRPVCRPCYAAMDAEFEATPERRAKAELRRRAALGDWDARDVLGGYDEWYDQFD
jgi:hypothetical protein